MSGANTAAARKPRRLSEALRYIMRHVRAFGSISPVEAGLIQHGGAHACRRKPDADRFTSCCADCCTDGESALDRLERLGLLVETRNLWRLGDRALERNRG